MKNWAKVSVLLIIGFVLISFQQKPKSKLEKIFKSPTIYLEHSHEKNGEKLTKYYTIKRTSKNTIVEYRYKKGHKPSKKVRNEIAHEQMTALRKIFEKGIARENGDSCGEKDYYRINDTKFEEKITVTDCSFTEIKEWAKAFEE